MKAKESDSGVDITFYDEAHNGPQSIVGNIEQAIPVVGAIEWDSESASSVPCCIYYYAPVLGKTPTPR